MSNAPTGAPAPNLGKSLLMLALICLSGLLIWKTFFGNGPLANILQDPKEVNMNYVPSDFQPNLDEENTLAILANPERYRREFNELVYNFNLSLLYHVGNRMGLQDSLKRKLEPQYKQHHDYLKNMYFNDFVALKDSSANLYETWYNDNTNSAVQIFNEVAGKYTCFFVTQIISTIVKSDNGKLMAKGKKIDTPCGIAISEGLKPMVDRLQKRAAIMDFSASRGLLKDKVQKGISELATYEIRSRKGISKQVTYDVFGINLSSTDIEVQAISVIKAGFDLNQYFDLTFNPKKGIVFVKLPQPRILSHEVYPKVDKLDVGILAGIDGKTMNEQFNALRREFRSDALENDRILQKAKMRADTVMQMMLGGVVHSMNRNYKLQVTFQETQEQIDAQELMRRGEAESSEKPVLKPRKKTDLIPN
jgi:hypothetical protein